MSVPTSPRPATRRQLTTSTEASPATRDRLATGEGQISVAEGVVQKIAGKACREVSGVHSMGTGSARAFGALRERIPGSSGPNVAQGVGVEVGRDRGRDRPGHRGRVRREHRRARPQYPAEREAVRGADDRAAGRRGQCRGRRRLPARHRRPGQTRRRECHDRRASARAAGSARAGRHRRDRCRGRGRGRGGVRWRLRARQRPVRRGRVVSAGPPGRPA